MRTATRLATISVAIAVAIGFVSSVSTPARAANAFIVSVSPTADPVAVGSTAIFKIRVEGQTAVLPSFNFEVEGGTLAGVASLDPTAANVAEGSVFVTRDSEGTARLKVIFGAEVLATGSARFAMLGTLNVSVSLDAGPTAAARTWRYEVLSTSGQVVGTLNAATSGDAPTTLVSLQNLPYGFYTVRQVFGSDTRESCASGVFYQVSSPVSGATTLELSSTSATVSFTIAPCPDLPKDLSVSIPIDTLSSPSGTIGEADVLPGETPVSEVRGTRQAGPGNPLPPSVGNSQPLKDPQTNLLLFVVVLATALVPVAAWSAVAVTDDRKQ